MPKTDLEKQEKQKRLQEAKKRIAAKKKLWEAASSQTTTVSHSSDVDKSEDYIRGHYNESFDNTSPLLQSGYDFKQEKVSGKNAAKSNFKKPATFPHKSEDYIRGYHQGFDKVCATISQEEREFNRGKLAGTFMVQKDKGNVSFTE